MNHSTKERTRYQRTQSVIIISDDDDDDDGDHDENHTTQTQFSTPIAQFNNEDNLSSIKPEEMDCSNSPIKSPIGLAQRHYLPYTLTSLNRERLSILPMYPIDRNQIHYNDIDIGMDNDNNNNDDHDDDDDNHELFLLLANVPDNQLSNIEREQRQPGKYKCPFSILESNNNRNIKSSFMLQQYQTYYESILQRFHIDLSILDFNYVRLKKFIHLYTSTYIRVVPANCSNERNFNVQENEFPQLLEFFLQTDIDLFYMKTCSFRQAKPRLLTEGIFCKTIPQCHYVMRPCGNCRLCRSQSNNQTSYSIAFNLYQKHRFVNGYESILNCPASCQTNNIIYAMTCQCGHYDYIGETSSDLFKRLSSHQCFTHRLILETLIGKKNYDKFWPGGGIRTTDMAKKDSMRLYQHPMRCSSVIQSFLNNNPNYWVFVPMLNEDADQENLQYQSSPTTTTTTIIQKNPTNIQATLNNLPKPPLGYKFSKFQIQKQYDFFFQQYYQIQTNVNYIVYHITMIAVLPLNTSDLFRRLIHSLLVTHAETKLNVLGHIFTYHLNGPINQGVWCANLRHRRRSSYH